MKNVLTEGQCCNNDEETKRTEDAKDGCQFSIPAAEDHCLLAVFKYKLAKRLQLTATKCIH